MKLTFLGTAASEGYPNPFCGCKNCRAARTAGGRSLRRRASALVDGTMLIDAGPDLIASTQALGLDLVGVRHVLQTHEHGDHIAPEMFHWRSFAGIETERLDWYGSAGSRRVLADVLGDLDAPEMKATFHTLRPFEAREIDGYRVTPVLAAHAPQLEVLLYLVERDGKTIFYATDTGPLPEATWRYFATSQVKVDLIAMDHTFGFGPARDGHMNAELFAADVARMRAEGFLAAHARVFAHHIAHDTHPPHDELVGLLKGRGYEAAYDGLTVEL